MTGAASDALAAAAERLHRSSLVIDTHIDTITHLVCRNPDFSTRLSEGRVDIPRLRQGGVGAAFFAIWVDDTMEPNVALQYTLRALDVMHRTIEKHPHDLELALCVGDVVRIHEAGRVAVLISIEGGLPLTDDLGVLRMLHRLGVRSVTLSWQRATNWIDSCNEEPHGGLTDLGRDIVLEMNRLGMLADISHVSDRAFWDVLEVASRPVFASHSSCRALCDVPRNMTDEMIEALAESGGVININFGSGFVDAAMASTVNPVLRPPQRRSRDGFDRIAHPSEGPGAPFESLVAHFDHAIALAGPDHVGIGSDFDGLGSLPQEMEDIGRLPRLTQGLLEHGHSEETVRKVLGLNNLRLIRDTIGG